MRIIDIRITSWRHFEGIELSVPDNAPIVCLVGGNGTGKTQILELIAASARQIGLSPGFESGRGDPFAESGDFEVNFYIAPQTVPTLDTDDLAIPEHLKEAFATWDRTLSVRRDSNGVNLIIAGCKPESLGQQLGDHLSNVIRRSQSIHYLMLDADRAYPRIQVPIHELGQAFETDWVSTTKSKSFMLTKSLYEEWFRYLLGTENRENNAHVKDIRIARERGISDPVFVDTMKEYRDAVKSVLPHLLFTGVESQKRQIEFDSTGVTLTFDQLSGGEREIAFLVGQIERFGLRKGLLLVDEPELHLNYDLLRAWIAFLKGSVDDGQIWLATHSLEVVEVTGQDATFLLERNEETRKVVNCNALADRPVVTTLSRAIGSPAFSISNLVFILVEGEENVGERERFRLLTGASSNIRFIEAGNCREVIRRIEVLRTLANASDQQIALGGVIDRDWREPSERKTISALGLHVLEVHEIENFLLHPDTVRYVMTSISQAPNDYDGILRTAADRRAGAYIFDATRTKKIFENFPSPHSSVRALVHGLTWTEFDDITGRCSEIAALDPQLDKTQSDLLQRNLETCAKIYSRKRQEDELWKICEGKEVFRSIAKEIGFSDADTAERAIIGAWKKQPALVPSELVQLREYVNSLH